MSDDFENAVRDAAAKLAGPGALPSYHDSWQRGLRRRYAKRAAIAGLGVVLLAALFAVDPDRLPGRGESVQTDLATGAAVLADEVAVPQAGTDQTQAEPGGPGQDPLAPAPTSAAESGPATATPTPTGGIEPTPTPGAASPTPVPTAPPAPTTVPPTPPAVAANTPAPTTVPSAVAATAIPLRPAATSTPAPFEAAAPSPTPAEITVDSPPPTVGPGVVVTEVPAATPAPAQATIPDGTQPADAAILGPGVAAGDQTCTFADGLPATCTPLDPYRCVDGEFAKPGYEGIDTDGDGGIDLCVATTTTSCDIDGDGLGDVPCEITPIPEAGADLGESQPPSG